MENKCIFCGIIIPEGRQVCRNCEQIEITSERKRDKNIDPLEYIADHYGVQSQIDQCIEELSELIKALCKYKRKYNSDVPNYEDSEELKHIAEELTDVGIMSDQLLYLLKIPEKEITKIASDKMIRQINRIHYE